MNITVRRFEDKAPFWTGSLEDFVANNEDIDERQHDAIERTLARGFDYHLGGGGHPMFVIERKEPGP